MTGPSLEGIDAEIRGQSYSKMEDEIKLLDDLILHINTGLAQLSGQKHDRGLNFLMNLLLNRAFNSLWRAREDAVCGYAPECLTLCRSALEHWTVARWVELNPEARDRWLWAILPEVKQPSKYAPTINWMLENLDELGEVPRQMYGQLSKFAHPRSKGLGWIIHFDSHSTYFHAGGHFDEHALRVCLYFLVGVTQACHEPVARLQKRMLGSPDSGWLGKGIALSEPAGLFLRRLEDEIIEQAGKLGG